MRPLCVQSVIWSAEHLDTVSRSGTRPVVLEIGRETGAGAAEGESGLRAYTEGHIPGAHYVPFERDLVGAPAEDSGPNPLPSAGDLERRLRAWGVHDGSTVVVHTRQNLAVAARAWWVLRWAGVENAIFLDGGLAAWRAIGGALDTRVPPPGAGTAVARPGSLPVLTARDAERLAASGHLLDARAPEAYAGDPRRPGTGHIPGAHSLPGSGNFTGGRLRDAAELTARYGAHLDGRPLGAYCGSGVSATTTVLALASLGIQTALYPGSWSEWITDPARPAATGDRPGAPEPSAA